MKQRIKNWLLKHLLNAVISESVATYTKEGKLCVGGQEITPDEAQNLVAEIQFIEKTRFWEICQNTIKDQAHKSMFENAKTLDDLFWGKALLYNLDLQNQVLNIIKSYKKDA